MDWLPAEKTLVVEWGDSYVIQQQLITTPVTARLSRMNKVGHRIAIFPGISTMHRAKKLGNKSTTVWERPN
jgi:hypothetical protein